MEKTDDFFENELCEILSNPERTIIEKNDNKPLCCTIEPICQNKKQSSLSLGLLIRLSAAIFTLALLFGFSLNIISR